ncbi:FAD-dependent oxidoreductase [Nocardioides limicola]|uniref:FAD-dependent oxidoreductase n=1 Tax=Nocardioides limicola TaxID=2803368 RepID=UPI00193BB909|nr:FAD-dependent oxidoreductase [Nocardioides sp. DJM-14]
MTRIRVLGAGIIGLSVADELARRGHRVQIVDPAPGSGASYAAAGMLSPGGEFWHGEEELTRLGRESLALWPEYAARLGVPLHTGGTVLAGVDAADAQQVDRHLAALTDAGVPATPLSRADLRDREPCLGRVTRGAWLPDERSVDPRQVLAALLSRHQVQPSAAGEVDTTVVATGATLPAPFPHLVRGVRGEIIRVRSDDPPRGTVRGWVRGQPVYLVPRRPRDGTAEVVIGATSEEHDAAAEVTVEGVRRLLEAAGELAPGLDRATFVEAIARDRPGTPDNLPLIGPSGRPDVLLAAGHYRHGVLLAPLTARLIADHVDRGVLEPAVDPQRFETPGAA